jgi:hypothetical protein
MVSSPNLVEQQCSPNDGPIFTVPTGTRLTPISVGRSIEIDGQTPSSPHTVHPTYLRMPRLRTHATRSPKSARLSLRGLTNWPRTVTSGWAYRLIHCMPSGSITSPSCCSLACSLSRALRTTYSICLAGLLEFLVYKLRDGGAVAQHLRLLLYSIASPARKESGPDEPVQQTCRHAILTVSLYLVKENSGVERTCSRRQWRT